MIYLKHRHTIKIFYVLYVVKKVVTLKRSNMKQVKVIITLLTIIIVFSINSVSASTALSMIDVTIPSLKREYISPLMQKTNFGPQYAIKYTARDVWSGDNRAVEANIQQVNNRWVTLNTSETRLSTEASGPGLVPANYKLKIRAKTVTLSPITFNGAWMLR